MPILSITTKNNAHYAVGEDETEKITFFSTERPFNKNKMFEGPCYIISFTDSLLQKIIPANCIVEVLVELIKTNTEHNKKNISEIVVFGNDDVERDLGILQ